MYIPRDWAAREGLYPGQHCATKGAKCVGRKALALLRRVEGCGGTWCCHFYFSLEEKEKRERKKRRRGRELSNKSSKKPQKKNPSSLRKGYFLADTKKREKQRAKRMTSL